MDNPWKGTLTEDFSLFCQRHPVLPSSLLWTSRRCQFQLDSSPASYKLAVKELYISAPGAFWSHCLTYSSSHLLLPLPSQEKAMPAQGFISHQINRSKRSNSPQPFYLHFSKGSHHLFLSLMLASQEQIRRFSLERATDCSWETKLRIPVRLRQNMHHCGNVKLDTASHLSCDLPKDSVRC